MKRRQFAFWCGMGLFGLAEKLRADVLDEFAAALMRSTAPAAGTEPIAPVHWTFAGNKSWQWYERENLIDGKWVLTGITTPINKSTGQPYLGKRGYLDDSLVPAEMWTGGQPIDPAVHIETGIELDPGEPNPIRKARHGRPPSKWLRSLHADEIRIWLKTIEAPEADVSGMTFWEHLTRDHSFDPEHLVGLTIPEQAKLHAAAHEGY